MAKPFKQLRDKMSPKAKAKANSKAREMLSGMPIHELRQALKLTQDEIAERMGINQAAVSKMERRPNILISTLRKYIEAMDAELRIQAKLPDGSVTFIELSDLE